MKRRSQGRAHNPKGGAFVPYRESLVEHEKEMENRKPETGNRKLVNLPVFHLRFPVSCFPFLPVRFRLCRAREDPPNNLTPKNLTTCFLIVLLLLLPSLLLAQSAAELRNSGRQIAVEIAAQKSANRFDTNAQRTATARVGKAALQYIDLCDKAASSGSEKRDAEALRGAYEALKEPLAAIYDASSGAMERQERKIMDEDGDLEALYETEDFKNARLTGSQALYYLNWLNYYGGRFYEGAKRKELIEKAQKGFSEFTSGERRTDLLVESQLGRGLSALELGDVDAAEHDLKAVMNDAQASAERRSKARLALLDGYVRNARSGDALTLSEQLLAGAPSAEVNVVRYLRVRALLDAAKKSPAAEAGRQRQQAMALMEQLRRAGGAWEERAAALLANIENPEQLSAAANSPVAKWQLAKLLLQKDDFKGAAPLLETVVSSNDTALKSVRDEARYYLAVAKFQAGQLPEAVALLDDALRDDSASYGAEATYLRFKALEAMLAKDANAVAPERYEAAVRAFAAHPDHKSAFEGAFRLGELLQRQHKFAEAVDAYARVKGDSAFELRADFATLQCNFELLQAAGPGTAPAQRTEFMNSIATALDRFPKRAAEYEKQASKDTAVPLPQLRGKWALLKAAFQTVQAQPDYASIAALLAGFEKNHPDLQEFFPQVTKLRLTALQQLGRFDEAAAEVKANGQLLAANNDAKTLEEMASGFIRAGANRKNAGAPAAYIAAEQVALGLYELVVNDADTGVKTKLTLAKLYENTGELHKAAVLYEETLQANPTLLPAMRGLARIAEAEKRLPDALAQWERLTKTSRGGDLTWYEGNYETARVTNVLGKKQDACDQLTALRSAMPGLTDADLKAKFSELYEQVCK